MFRDPDQTDMKLDESKEHLAWKWNCTDLSSGDDCSYLLDNTTASKPEVDLGDGSWYVFSVLSIDKYSWSLMLHMLSQGL